MRALVVGTGGISNAWFGPLKDHGVEVAGVVDLDPERAREQLAKHEVTTATVFTDVNEALSRCEADFAVDLTTPAAHHKITRTCLEAGLPVIGEKPMAEKMEQAREMVAASEKSGKLYMVSQSRRYVPDHYRIADTIAAGGIGKVTTILCDFYIGAHFGGFRAEMDHVLLNDMSIHHFDLARMFTGLDPVSVFAEEFNPEGSWYRSGPAAHCLFTMTEGVRFAYRGSWCSDIGDAGTSWHGNWTIIGTRGAVVYEDEKLDGRAVTSDEGFVLPTQELVYEPLKKEVLPGQSGALAEFLDALRNGTTPQGECHDNIKSMAMVSYAIDSATRDERVSIEV